MIDLPLLALRRAAMVDGLISAVELAITGKAVKATRLTAPGGDGMPVVPS
ncbi:hypothetical protein [Bradyrhizobium sp. 27S5]